MAGGRPHGRDGAAISGVHSMSDYSRRGREASGPPLVISKYSPARARTSSSALLCPPAPPALGREFRFQKAMMALARAEIPPISKSMSLSWKSTDYSAVSQSVFPGPNRLVPQGPKKYLVFPEGHRQGRWPAAGWDFPANSACMRMLNRIDRLILLLGTGELEYLECCFGRRESAEIGFPCMAQQDPSSSYSTRLAAFTTTPLSTRREVLPRHTDFPTRPHLNSLIT